MTVPQTTIEYTEKFRQALQRDTTLRQLAAQATARYAGEKARIDRGLGLALNGHVTLNEDGSAEVLSGSGAEVVYHVAHGTCDCPDFARAPDGRCKHRWAACLVKKATKAMAHYTTTTPSQGLVLGGNRAIADTKRAEEEAAGGLVALLCHHHGARRN
jgi:hypothetical protein